MSKKTKRYQAHVNSTGVAKAGLEFVREFRKDNTYPEETMTYFMVVGPVQSYLGFLVENGYITVNNEMVPEEKLTKMQKFYRDPERLVLLTATIEHNGRKIYYGRGQWKSAVDSYYNIDTAMAMPAKQALDIIDELNVKSKTESLWIKDWKIEEVL